MIGVAADITDQAAIDAVVRTAGEKLTRFANIAGNKEDLSPLHETSDAVWERVLGVNLTGAFKPTRAVLPLMLEAEGGFVVNVSSEAGLRGNASRKRILSVQTWRIGLTKSAAYMYGPRDVRVNAVAAGGVATRIPLRKHVSEAGLACLRRARSRHKPYCRNRGSAGRFKRGCSRGAIPLPQVARATSCHKATRPTPGWTRRKTDVPVPTCYPGSLRLGSRL